MAQSRLERIGTIFTRVSNLMKGGAMKIEDKPLWYDVYQAFPPKLEPVFDRAAPNVPVREIFYKEDIIRAKFHKEPIKFISNLTKQDKSNTQQFLAIYQELEKEGIPENEIYNKALEKYKLFNETISIKEPKPAKKIEAPKMSEVLNS